VNTVVVVGNPRLGSRTRQAAELVVERLTGASPTAVIELAEIGPALLAWGDPVVTTAKEQVLGADLLVIADP
jgi:FMN reductase